MEARGRVLVLLCTIYILKFACLQNIVFAFSGDVCRNYTVLSGADRAQGNVSQSNLRHDLRDLTPGWYRFQGDAGDRMADKCLLMYRCNAVYPGWLSGAHPTVAEGVAVRNVCYSFYYDCCKWSNNIKVKNCSSYYVYELQKTPEHFSRYCGNGGAVDGCKNYTVLSEADRAQVNTVRGDLCDGSLLTGWYRFQGPAGDKMLDKCVPMYRCGAWYPGWLNGAHPTVNEGVVVRTACFHAGINMCCATSNNIKVKNCSSYYVYELQQPWGCALRYCGNADVVITCSALPAPSNGSRLGCSGNATMYYDTVCQFSCNNGYIGSGSQVRRCQKDGTWSGQDFTCQIVTCPALPLPSNSVRHDCTANATKYPYDTVCRFSCVEGYKVSGSSVRRCQENGQWNGVEFSCEKILCEPLQLAPNIRMKAACTRLPGDACEFACRRGYNLIGPDIRRCNSDGSWTGTQPRCEAVTCRTLLPPTNGELLGCNTTEMLYDTVCRFSCKEGSEASGSTVRRCTENGTWSENDLVCTVLMSSANTASQCLFLLVMDPPHSRQIVAHKASLDEGSSDTCPTFVSSPEAREAKTVTELE
ncbi:hypothetical protein ACROYT_G034000 [Oculina patagonica]